MKINGDSLEQLTHQSSGCNPDWAPDDITITFNSSDSTHNGIRFLNLKTGNSRLITPQSLRPTWFPNGERLLVDYLDRENQRWQLTVIDTNGVHLKTLTDDESIMSSIDISRDGKYLCFTRQLKKGYEWSHKPDIWIMKTDSTGLRQITDDGGSMASFSPDGKWVVYTCTGNEDGHLWIMKTDGSEKRRLTK
jgi:Tol biopolymer transport system component